MARTTGTRSTSNSNSNRSRSTGGNRSTGSNRSSNSSRQSDSFYGSGVIDTAREAPFKSAAVAAAAVGAGVFLWSRRNQISDQISQLSEQISDWASSMTSDSGSEFGDDTGGLTTEESEISQGAGRTSRSKGSRPTMTQGTNEPASVG